ncbi:hypothetical protein, partial [Enterobacter hormaechei]|uniref:hypothetical protein n=1 Tax=Enterobacter hormaechei TaxID=158836 RepID=UPI002FF209E7
FWMEHTLQGGSGDSLKRRTVAMMKQEQNQQLREKESSVKGSGCGNKKAMSHGNVTTSHEMSRQIKKR